MEKILVIDDDSDAMRHLSRIVISIGHETVYSFGGLSALEIVYDDQPDLMLLDLTTPLYDDVDTLNLLLGNSLTRPVPLVMIAAIADRERVLTGMGAGAVDYIEKPISAADLEFAIQRYLPSVEPVGEFSSHRAIRLTNIEIEGDSRAAYVAMRPSYISVRLFAASWVIEHHCVISHAAWKPGWHHAFKRSLHDQLQVKARNIEFRVVEFDDHGRLIPHLSGVRFQHPGDRLIDERRRYREGTGDPFAVGAKVN